MKQKVLQKYSSKIHIYGTERKEYSFEILVYNAESPRKVNIEKNHSNKYIQNIEYSEYN